jgi:ribosome-binding protein aMBF1 (putative translation factor)
MKQEKNIKVIDRYRDRVKPENKIYIRKNLQISERVSELLEEKGWSQKEFARRLGKKESEVSKWLSGLHNLTLKSITKMEAVLEEDIIQAPVLAREIDHLAP